MVFSFFASLSYILGYKTATILLSIFLLTLIRIGISFVFRIFKLDIGMRNILKSYHHK